MEEIKMKYSEIEDFVNAMGNRQLINYSDIEYKENYLSIVSDTLYLLNFDDKALDEIKMLFIKKYLNNSLLYYLLFLVYDPCMSPIDRYLQTAEEYKELLETKEWLKSNDPRINDFSDEDREELDTDIETCEETLKTLEGDWRLDKDSSMEKEIEIIKNWLKRKDVEA